MEKKSISIVLLLELLYDDGITVSPFSQYIQEFLDEKGQIHEEIVRKVPGRDPDILFHVPTPKGVIRIPLEN